MSWSIKAVGTRTAIKAKIEASPYLPESLKAAAREVIDANTALPDRLVKFESNGHVGGGSGSVGMFSITTIELAPEPTPPPPAS